MSKSTWRVHLRILCNDIKIATKSLRALRKDLNWHRNSLYTDWFLPSKDELNELYLQKNVVGGFLSGHYWSSSETTNAAIATAQYFVNGNQLNLRKDNTYRVRAIRAF